MGHPRGVSVKLEHQVANLELSKRIKELGVRQDGLYTWHWLHIYEKSHEDYREYIREFNPHWFKEHVPGDDWPWSYCVAFTVAELGVMLPKEVNGFPLLIEIIEGKWCFNYVEHDNSGYEYRLEEDGATEAEVRAKMLIGLIEMKYITVEEINQRMGLAE